MPDADAVQAIRDAIHHLETEIDPVQAEIDQVRTDAHEQIARLEAQVTHLREALDRWLAARDRAEGRTPPMTSSNRRPTALEVSDQQLRDAIRATDGPTTVAALRQLLEVDDDVPAAKMTRLLSDAVRRGIVTRSGEGRATRYAAP